MDISITIQQQNSWDLVKYMGPINEEAEVHLAQLLAKLGPKVRINLGQVAFVNSCGVRGWINFIRELEKDREVVFEECTSEIVMQINMIPSFRGNAKIESVFATFSCESCGHEESVLFIEGKNLPKTENDRIEPSKCSKCKEEMEMQEIEDEYFSFLAA